MFKFIVLIFLTFVLYFHQFLGKLIKDPQDFLNLANKKKTALHFLEGGDQQNPTNDFHDDDY